MEEIDQSFHLTSPSGTTQPFGEEQLVPLVKRAWTIGRIVLMKNDEARQLRVFWEAKGNPPCDHPTIEKERFGEGGHTGFYVCTTCGAYIGPAGE